MHPLAGASWNVVSDVQQMFAYPFMVNAFRAGTLVAITAAVAGWFMVLRRQTFAGHTLAVVAFPGAAAAILLGVAAPIGYFTFCIVAALVIAAGRGGATRGFHGESAVIGTVQAFALACGFLFVALYHGFLTGVTGLLFGTFLGISNGQVLALLLVALVTVVAFAVIGRPLLFASIDPGVAAARGLPVRGLAIGFLVLLGAAAAAASQVTGALLVFALLVMPAATAQRLTARPATSLALSLGLALLVTWLGLTIAYFFPSYPIGFTITTPAFALYLLASGYAALT